MQHVDQRLLQIAQAQPAHGSHVVEQQVLADDGVEGEDRELGGLAPAEIGQRDVYSTSLASSAG